MIPDHSETIPPTLFNTTFQLHDDLFMSLDDDFLDSSGFSQHFSLENSHASPQTTKTNTLTQSQHQLYHMKPQNAIQTQNLNLQASNTSLQIPNSNYQTSKSSIETSKSSIETQNSNLKAPNIYKQTPLPNYQTLNAMQAPFSNLHALSFYLQTQNSNSQAPHTNPQTQKIYSQNPITHTQNSMSTQNSFDKIQSFNSNAERPNSLSHSPNAVQNTIAPKSNSEVSESSGYNLRRKFFSPEEDRKLAAAALAFRQGSWNKIAECVPGRTPKQCRDRWVNYLQPSLKFEPWTDEEDRLLVSLVNSYGTHFAQMKKNFPNRSTNSLKNRWYWLIKQKSKVIHIEKSNNNFEKNNDHQQENNENGNYYLFVENSNNLTNSKKTRKNINESNSRKKYFIKNNGNIDENDLICFNPDELNW